VDGAGAESGEEWRSGAAQRHGGMPNTTTTTPASGAMQSARPTITTAFMTRARAMDDVHRLSMQPLKSYYRKAVGGEDGFYPFAVRCVWLGANAGLRRIVGEKQITQLE
jgi:hypothetical protein